MAEAARRWLTPARRVALYRLAARAASGLPQRWAYRAARAAGVVVSLAPGPRREALRGNIAAAHGLPAWHPAVRRDARRAAIHAQLNYVDLLRLSRPAAREEVRRLPVPDWSILDQALGQGKGLVLISAHLGNFDIVVQSLAARGIPTLVPVERIEPPELLEFFRSQRAALGIEIEPVGPDTFKRMAARLRAGGVVAIMCDRDIQGTGQEVRLFGRTTSLPSAAVLLALRTGAPMVAAFGYRYADGGISGRVAGLVALDDDAATRRGARERAAEGMRRLSALFEREIRRDPGQWVVQQPVFGRGSAAGGAA